MIFLIYEDFFIDMLKFSIQKLHSHINYKMLRTQELMVKQKQNTIFIRIELNYKVGTDMYL